MSSENFLKSQENYNFPTKYEIISRKVWEKFFKVFQPRKIKSQTKIHNFAFKNSNIVIEGIIQKRKDYFP